MKILVDANELMAAFNIVSDMKNLINTLPAEYLRKKLQIVCDILGPMWVDGVDTGKILVDKKELDKLLLATSSTSKAMLANIHEMVKTILCGNPINNNKIPLNKTEESLTREVLLELLLVICKHSHPDTPIIWQKACELYEKLNGGEHENIG